MTRYLFITLLAAMTLMSGCQIIYKQNVQQGNAHEQEDLDQIELGMTKKQVAYLLGTPAINDPFHQDRWDYISLFSRRGNDPVRRLVTLTFENDLLIATDGIGDSTGGDIKALADTRSAVQTIDDLDTARNTELITENGVINWTLQLGAFYTHEEAEVFAATAREKGIDTHLAEQVVPGLGTRHQVRSGNYKTFNEARIALADAEKALKIIAITVPIEIPTDTSDD